jgi:hypothetical protein
VLELELVVLQTDEERDNPSQSEINGLQVVEVKMKWFGIILYAACFALLFHIVQSVSIEERRPGL